MVASSNEPSPFPVEQVRKDFPILERRVNGRPIVYLDSAATSLKPKEVVRTPVDFYENHCGSVNRAVHRLGEEATELFENARETTADFINADPRDIVFVRNSTKAINLLARNLPPGAGVLHTLAEHHSNFVPWLVRSDARAGRSFLPGGSISRT